VLEAGIIISILVVGLLLGAFVKPRLSFLRFDYIFKTIFVLMVVGGVVLFSEGFRDLQNELSPGDWAYTSGAILDATADSNNDSIFTVNYIFSVDGITYSGSDTANPAISDSHNLFPGQSIMVFYNPSDPAQSALSDEVPDIGYIKVVTAGFMMLVGCFFLVRILAVRPVESENSCFL